MSCQCDHMSAVATESILNGCGLYSFLGKGHENLSIPYSLLKALCCMQTVGKQTESF